MKRYKTEEDVKHEHLDKLGTELGTVFHHLYNDFAWLRVKWGEYKELFGTKPERLEILNSSAGLFFRVVQDTMWEDTLLHLSRLTDKVSVGRKKNITIRRLPELCVNDSLRISLQDLVDQAITATEFARDWRNRQIGHRDFDLAINHDAKPLAYASRKSVNEAISAIHAVLNHISEQMLNSTMSTEVITPSGGAFNLLYTLSDGLDAINEREERLRSGNPNPDDFKNRDI